MSDELDAMLRALRGLSKPKDLEAAIAKAAAPILQSAIKATLSAGQSPEGQAWAPKKKDGSKAYVHAPDKIDTKAFGNLIAMTLTGPEVYGHFGAQGHPVRRMIPDAGAGMPDSVDKALTEASSKVFDELTK